MQAQLLKFSDKCFLSLTNNLNEVGENYSFVSIHKLRLSIKKFHAILGILNDREEIKAVNGSIKIIDQVFLKAGLLRDNQVQIEILKSYRNRVDEDVDLIVARLKSENKRNKEIIKHRIKRINPFDIVLLNQRIDNVIEAMNDSAIECLLHAKAIEIFNQMKEVINNNLNEKFLHRIRIKLRELVYTLSIIKKGVSKTRLDSAVIVYLKNLQLKLGRWHDLKVFTDRLYNLKVELNSLISIIELDERAKKLDILNELVKLSDISLYA